MHIEGDEPEVTQDLPQGEPVLETAENEAPETVTEQAPEEPEEEAPKPKHKPWFQERIDQLTREKHDERRNREALEARLSALEADPAAPKPVADVDALAAKKAEQIVQQRQFDDKCNEVYNTGKQEFSDFDETIANFSMLGGIPVPVLEAVNQLPDSHKILYSLGQNMDEATRILNLAPVPMALALAKLSMSPVKTKPVSNAPPPIRTIDGSTRGEKDPEKMSMDEWMKWREDQLKT
jgi:hypothetical protein